MQQKLAKDVEGKKLGVYSKFGTGKLSIANE